MTNKKYIVEDGSDENDVPTDCPSDRNADRERGLAVDACLDRDRLRGFVLLTGVQRDLLFVIAGLARTDPSGSDIKSVVDADDLREVSHGTLYRSLRRLHDEGYLQKRPIDGRTYSYHLTCEAETALRSYLCWARNCLGDDGGPDDASAVEGDR